MSQSLNETIAVLERTPATLNALLRDLPQMWTMNNEGPNTWSAHGVIGHLIHGEQTDWMPRVKMILESGERATFARFDRQGHQDSTQDQPIENLLDEFASLRAENLSALRALNLQPKDLDRRGRHPVLGVVTLSQLLATWAVHDLTHLHQISRILAHQYRDEVGLWSAYLGVLKCAGHSSP
ncbi:MAG TPA: DinB family protein [Candidatus Acidoferrales bacterium]